MRAVPKSLNRPLASLLILLPIMTQRLQAQNLVPNPSFEDVNICSEYSQPCSPSAWFYLSRKLTTGYYPRYPSATGHRHLQILAASRTSPNRQYWETKLLCPLQAGERYAVTLKIAAPANRIELSKTCPSLRDIGLWFTNGFIFVQGDSLLQPRSFLSFTSASGRDLKNGWFEIKKEFTANASASILIVGNFGKLANDDLMDQRNAPGSEIDILVDDISVVPLKAQTCPFYEKTKDSLYAIHRRHSKKLIPDALDPDAGDSIPDIARTETPPLPQSNDSTSRPRSNPINDPLFGPEPRRRVDSPPSAPSNPSSSIVLSPAPDTIVIHNIQFDFDKYLMQNPDTLKRYRSLLTRPGVKKIEVVGFTDDAGSETYNLDLSQKRAREIARLLSQKLEIPASLIETEGRGISRKYGEKWLNRRVEIYIFH